MIDFSFIEGKYAVHCPTLAEAIDFYTEFNIKFPDKTRIWKGIEDVKRCFGYKGDKFAFGCTGMLRYASVDYYIENSYRVFTYDEIVNSNVLYEDVSELDFMSVIGG